MSGVGELNSARQPRALNPYGNETALLHGLSSGVDSGLLTAVATRIRPRIQRLSTLRRRLSQQKSRPKPIESSRYTIIGGA